MSDIDPSEIKALKQRVKQLEVGYDTLRTTLHRREAELAAAKAALDKSAELNDWYEKRCQWYSGELAAAKAKCENLKFQAEGWTQEARTQKATVHEIYQLVSGATGEHGDWHGAEPVRAYIAAAKADAERMRERIRGIEDAAVRYEADPVDVYDKPSAWNKLGVLLAQALPAIDRTTEGEG